MNKAALLAAASVTAICAAGASAPATAATFQGLHRSMKTLWNQLSNDAPTAILSDNFTSGAISSDNAQGADDFVIPEGRTWRIREVDAGGAFGYNGPAISENVIFYKDHGGMPGKPVRNGSYSNLEGTGGPNYSIVLPGKGLRLGAGRYWVSVIANMNFIQSNIWNWDVNPTQKGSMAMWQNPAGGLDVCQNWATIDHCLHVGPDLMFALKGTSR